MMEAQQEEERMQMTARTVGELIDILSQLPADSIPISIEPPFTGVSVVPQDGQRAKPRRGQSAIWRTIASFPQVNSPLLLLPRWGG